MRLHPGSKWFLFTHTSNLFRQPLNNNFYLSPAFVVFLTIVCILSAQSFSSYAQSPDGKPQSTQSASIESVDVLAERLHQRLLNNPDDMNGWVLLGKSYHHLQQWEKAKDAFTHAKKLGYQGEVPSIDIAEQNNTQPANAFPYWQENNWVGYINDSLLTQKPKPVIHLKLTFSEAIKRRITGNASIYVFIRDSKQPSPPLAVIKYNNLNEVPAVIILSDDNAMVPSHRLSTSENFMVGARISLSGNPVKQAGDIEVLSTEFSQIPQETINLYLDDGDSHQSIGG